MSVDILQADARRIPLADESVQCCVTSPPYWGLRKYAGEQELVWASAQGECEHEFKGNGETKRRPDRCGGNTNGHHGVFVDSITRGQQASKSARGQTVQHGGTCRHCGAWRGAYGLEPTIEMYTLHTLQILREIRRVLRKDGVVFFNLGDSYATGAGSARNPGGKCFGKSNDLVESGNIARCQPNRMPQVGLKPKDLCLIPARVALAAQADGWWVRSMIIWAKPNPMPESVTDRPTDAYEHIIMLTKAERYYWDADAVREETSGTTHSRGAKDDGPKQRQRESEGNHVGWTDSTREVLTSCNLRNVWTFATQPYAGAHFATFPEELPRRCILASTSARGACAQCGTPWVRVVRASGGTIGMGDWTNKKVADEQGKHWGDAEKAAAATDGTYRRHLIGWRPGCLCRGQHGKTVPCVVLDPFGGSGTTGRVAVELNRRAVLLDLAYHGLARKRTTNVQRMLPSAEFPETNPTLRRT